MTKEISVFIDESGTFHSERHSSRHYIVCMIFHNQENDITRSIEQLETSFTAMGLDRSHCVHAGPLIRREREYEQMTREQRRGIFRRLFLFMNAAPITYRSFLIDKAFMGTQGIHDPLLQRITGFLLAHASTFSSFDKLKIYYDNGQNDLTTLLREAFALFAARTEFIPEVNPSRYRLFQVADMACTLELARAKLNANEALSESENAFFGGTKNLKKNFLKLLDRKIFA